MLGPRFLSASNERRQRSPADLHRPIAPSLAPFRSRRTFPMPSDASAEAAAGRSERQKALKGAERARPEATRRRLGIDKKALTLLLLLSRPRPLSLSPAYPLSTTTTPFLLEFDKLKLSTITGGPALDLKRESSEERGLLLSLFLSFSRFFRSRQRQQQQQQGGVPFFFVFLLLGLALPTRLRS